MTTIFVRWWNCWVYLWNVATRNDNPAQRAVVVSKEKIPTEKDPEKISQVLETWATTYIIRLHQLQKDNILTT